MYDTLLPVIKKELETMHHEGLFKHEHVITSHQSAVIQTDDGNTVINFCSNNYLGMCAHPDVVAAAKKTLDTHGYGMSSVRFICGTQNIHKTLETKIAHFLHAEEAILYAAAFDANGGLFEPLLNQEDAIISDELNHASIIDGIRLCKASRYRYKHNDMEDLKRCLEEATKAGVNQKMIVTDGVFSMDGTLAQLDKICDLAEQYNALTVVDDSHASGFVGKTGRGTPEYHGVTERIDIITSTLGKALGGASGGFTAGKREFIEILRQRSRPYLFSNTLAPSIVGGAIEVFNLVEQSAMLRDKLNENTRYFRTHMTNLGFDIPVGDHPIVPVMLYDAKVAQQFATLLLEEGIYAVGFFYPVVPQDQARIRIQLSASHERKHLDKAINAFATIGKKLHIL